MRIAVLDTETTGLKSKKHEILEIACIVYEFTDDGSKNIVKSFEKKLSPRNLEVAEPKALEINGYSEEKWKNSIDFSEIYDELSQILEESDLLMGQNLIFDLKFIQSECKRRNLGKISFPAYIDTKSMADELKRANWIHSTSLDNLISHYKIVIEGRAHTALCDCERTMAVFEKLCVDLDNDYRLYTFDSPYYRRR